MKTPASKIYYMHTLNGLPAVFVPKQGICFASFYGKANELAASLNQIRKEKKENDRIRGKENEHDFRYGYVRVRTP